SGVVTIQPQTSDVADIENGSENCFYEDLTRQYQHVFGNPTPSIDELATIHLHASAYQQVRVGHPDSMCAIGMETIGQAVYASVLGLLVYQESAGLASGDGITTKANYIYASDHLVRRLQSFGLARVMTGRSMETTGAAHEATGPMSNVARAVSF